MAFKMFGITFSRTASAPPGDENLNSLNAANAQTLNFVTNDQAAKPLYTAEATVYERCRYWARESSYLKAMLPLKRSIFNCGFKLKAVEKKNQAKLEKWLAEDSPPPVDKFEDSTTQETVEVESTTTNAERIAKFMDDAWVNWFLFDSIVAMWRDETEYALILQPERVEYSDVRGVEVVRYSHGLGQSDVERYLPTEAQQRFLKPTIILNPKEGEHFKVLKRGAVGEGLGTPGMFSVFNVLSEQESKEAGMKALGFTMRTVKRVHKLGHPIESGLMAGKPHHFWSKKRSADVLTAWRDRVGLDDYTCNFDETVEYPWPDVKLFDAKFFASSVERLNTWAGPLAQMYFLKQTNPILPTLLKAEAMAEREKMGAFLGSVITRAFGIGFAVKPQWSNTIFNEARLQAEMLKFAVQNGLVSNETAQEEYGLNPAQEDDRKVAEASDPEATKKHKPLWDQAHGIAPALGESSQPKGGAAGKGQAPDANNGRPAGSQTAK